MLKLTSYNPYRILGVYANSPKRDIVSNKGKATAFLKVNRPVEFPLDLKGILPVPNRTLDIINEAEAHLAIAKEQIKYAQFWFLQKMSPFDDIALNHLLAGNMAGALDIWSKKLTLSSLQNRLVCFLIENKYELAVKTAEILYEKFGNIYISNIDANCTLQMSGTDLLRQFVDSLGEEIGMQKLLGFEIGAETKAYIRSQTIDPIISKISSDVERAKKVDHKDAQLRKEAGQNLIISTKEPLLQLKEILPSLDSQYQMIADKLGLEILQCGIDYFNNSEDDDAPRTAMKIQKYAQSVVVGGLAIQRCNENVKILQEIIDNLPPQEVAAEDKAIKAELSKFVKLPDKISYAISLLNSTKSHIQRIKNKLGASNSYYLKISTQIVGNALHNVIEEVNEAQKPLAKLSEVLSPMDPYLRTLLSGGNFNVDEIRDKLKSTLREAWKATIIMDEFDLESDFRTRYNQNRNTLQSLCSQMGVSTYGSTSSTSRYGTTSSKTTLGHGPQNNDNSGSGCMVTLLAIMGMAAMSIYCIVYIL